MNKQFTRNSFRVLLDLDQVLADFESHFLELFRGKYPDHPFIPIEKRKGFHLTEQYKGLHPDAVVCYGILIILIGRV